MTIYDTYTYIYIYTYILNDYIWYIHIYTHTYSMTIYDTYTHIYIYIHTYIHTYSMTIYDTYTYIYIHTYSMTIYDTYTYIYIYIHTQWLYMIHTHIYIYIYTYILNDYMWYIHTYIYIYTYILNDYIWYIHIYIYIYTYILNDYIWYIHTYIYIYVSIHVPSSHVITSSQEVSTIPITRLCFNLSLHPTTRSALLGHFLILLCDRAERVDSVTTDGPLANMTPFKWYFALVAGVMIPIITVKGHKCSSTGDFITKRVEATSTKHVYMISVISVLYLFACSSVWLSMYLHHKTNLEWNATNHHHHQPFLHLLTFTLPPTVNSPADQRGRAFERTEVSRRKQTLRWMPCLRPVCLKPLERRMGHWRRRGEAMIFALSWGRQCNSVTYVEMHWGSGVLNYNP